MEKNKIFRESVGEVDLNELEELAQAGGTGIQPESTPITVSSLECIELSIDASVAASMYFSCGKMC